MAGGARARCARRRISGARRRILSVAENCCTTSEASIGGMTGAAPATSDTQYSQCNFSMKPGTSMDSDFSPAGLCQDSAHIGDSTVRPSPDGTSARSMSANNRAGSTSEQYSRRRRRFSTERMLARECAEATLFLTSREMTLRDIEKARAGLGVFDHGPGIVFPEPDARSSQRRLRCSERRVDPLRRKLRELGHPTAYVVSVGVELFALRDRIEDSKPRLRVAAATRRPLPAGVVVGPVAIGQQLEVVLLAATKVDQQMLGEKTRGDHARAVVHESSGQEFARGGIHDRVSRGPVDPCAPALLVIAPRKTAPVGAERFVEQRGTIEESGVRELAPE